MSPSTVFTFIVSKAFFLLFLLALPFCLYLYFNIFSMNLLFIFIFGPQLYGISHNSDSTTHLDHYSLHTIGFVCLFAGLYLNSFIFNNVISNYECTPKAKTRSTTITHIVHSLAISKHLK